MGVPECSFHPTILKRIYTLPYPVVLQLNRTNIWQFELMDLRCAQTSVCYFVKQRK